MNKDITDLYRLRKTDHIGALKRAEEAYCSDENDYSLNAAYAWILIDDIKSHLDEDLYFQARKSLTKLLSIRLESGDSFVKQITSHIGWSIYNILKSFSGQMTSHEVRRLMADYIKLDIERPSLLHSLMLVFAIKYAPEHTDFNFYNFFKLWNPETFRTEDWERKPGTDGTSFKSLAEQALSAAFESSKRTLSDRSKDSIQWLSSLYYKALSAFPDNVWLKRELAFLRLWSGEKTKSIELYKEIIKIKGDQYFIWQEAAALIEDTDTRIGLLSKALLLQSNEDFIGDIRLKMAECLIHKRMYQEAHIELNHYYQNRTLHNWKIDPSYFRMKENIGTDNSDEKSGSNIGLYKRYVHYAEELAYSDIEQHKFCIMDSSIGRSNGKLYFLLSDGHNSFPVKSSKIQKSSKVLRLGDILAVRKSDDTVVSAVKTDDAPWSILPTAIFVVTNVNQQKCLFHLSGPPGEANVLFRDTHLRPSLRKSFSGRYYFAERDGVSRLRIVPSSLLSTL